MDRLSLKDLSALLEFLRESYAFHDLDDFARRSVQGVQKVIRSDVAAYNEYNVGRRRIEYVTEPDEPVFRAYQDVLGQHLGDHPGVAHHARTRDGRTTSLSDFLTRGQYHRLGIYNEFYRRFDVEYQVLTHLPSRPGLHIAIALNRSRRDFTGQERFLLDLLRPHLAQAYRNSEAVTRLHEQLALTRKTLEELDQGVIILGKSGRVGLITERARKRLTEYFGKLGVANRLPAEFLRWVKEQQIVLGKKDSVPPPCTPLLIERGEKKLIVRLIPEPDQSLLILEERRTTLDPKSFEPLGLTPREAQVLAWMAQGKTNREIGTILGTSSKTVEKHLERIFQKLGVETRTAAARRAFEFAYRGELTTSI